MLPDANEMKKIAAKKQYDEAEVRRALAEEYVNSEEVATYIEARASEGYFTATLTVPSDYRGAIIEICKVFRDAKYTVQKNNDYVIIVEWR